jgi:hypothetical protein
LLTESWLKITLGAVKNSWAPKDHLLIILRPIVEPITFENTLKVEEG